MRKHFPCESGCTVELGPDVPAYVADPNQTLYRYCLITQVLKVAVWWWWCLEGGGGRKCWGLERDGCSAGWLVTLR